MELDRIEELIQNVYLTRNHRDRLCALMEYLEFVTSQDVIDRVLAYSPTLRSVVVKNIENLRQAIPRHAYLIKIYQKRLDREYIQRDWPGDVKFEFF